MTRATIMNIVKIRVKNDTTFMISNLLSRHKLHGQIRNKRSIRGMKKSQNKACPVQQLKEGNHRWYEQCNGDKKDAKQKDE
jgi:hypothetical protein